MIEIRKVVKYEGVYNNGEDDYCFHIIDDDWVEWDYEEPENEEEIQDQILKEYKLFKEKENGI